MFVRSTNAHAFLVCQSRRKSAANFANRTTAIIHTKAVILSDQREPKDLWLFFALSKANQGRKPQEPALFFLCRHPERFMKGHDRKTPGKSVCNKGTASAGRTHRN